MYLLRFQACVWHLLGRANVSLVLSPASVSCYESNKGYEFTVQHIYSHAQNLGNECADHAAALGTYGLTSNHNTRTRWTRSSFDSNSLFARCDNLDDALQVLRNARTAHAPAPQHLVRSWRHGSRRVSPWSLVYVSSSFSSFWTFVRHLAQSMQAPLSPVEDIGWQWMNQTSSDSVDFNEHNIWNPVLEQLFHVLVGAFTEAYFDEVELGRIALSCHFALDVCPDARSIRRHCHW